MKEPENPVDRKKLEKVWNQLQRTINKAFGTDDDGSPRVELHLIDRSRYHVPSVPPIPYHHLCESVEDYHKAFQDAFYGMQACVRQADTEFSVLRHHLDYERKHDMYRRVIGQLFQEPWSLEKDSTFSYRPSPGHRWISVEGFRFDKQSQKISALRKGVREQRNKIKKHPGKVVRWAVLLREACSQSQSDITVWGMAVMTEKEKKARLAAQDEHKEQMARFNTIEKAKAEAERIVEEAKKTGRLELARIVETSKAKAEQLTSGTRHNPADVRISASPIKRGPLKISSRPDRQWECDECLKIVEQASMPVSCPKCGSAKFVERY